MGTESPKRPVGRSLIPGGFNIGAQNGWSVVPLRREVEEFLARWARVTEARDPERSADLFLREPAALVTFTDGQRARDWLDVRVRLGRDLERAILDRVDVHDVEAMEVGDGAIVASFRYELEGRNVWGTPSSATRVATMTLVRTKDGLRIAAAHFSLTPFEM